VAVRLPRRGDHADGAFRELLRRLAARLPRPAPAGVSGGHRGLSVCPLQFDASTRTGSYARHLGPVIVNAVTRESTRYAA
jgi:hypothetical protein